MYSPGLGKHGAICKTEAKREGPGSTLKKKFGKC